VGWLVIARVLAGIYWLYFGVQKWFNYSWVPDTLTIAAGNNPIPAYGEFLRNFVLPNWQLVTVLQTTAETLIGVGLILGLFSRLFGFLGVFLAANLTLTLGFSFPDFALIFWYYALSLILNMTVLLSDTGRIFGLDRFILKRFRTNKLLSLVM
jgi:thiosulfate dehydrogenase [quinone] large subunit